VIDFKSPGIRSHPLQTQHLQTGTSSAEGLTAGYFSGNVPGINADVIGSYHEACWQSRDLDAILIAWGSAKRRDCEYIIFV